MGLGAWRTRPSSKREPIAAGSAASRELAVASASGGSGDRSGFRFVSEDSERMREAVARLSADQQALVVKCLAAVVGGPYIVDDHEFGTVTGSLARKRRRRLLGGLRRLRTA